MSRKCSKCNEPSPPDANFCIFCGMAFPKADGDAKEPSGAGNGTFRFKWVLFGALFMVGGIIAVSVVLGLVAAIAGMDIGGPEDPTLLFLGGVAASLGLFGGSVLTGFRSPGVTVREPVVAIILVIVLMNLLTGNIAGIFLGWLIPALLAFAGARLGEHLQRRRGR